MTADNLSITEVINAISQGKEIEVLPSGTTEWKLLNYSALDTVGIKLSIESKYRLFTDAPKDYEFFLDCPIGRFKVVANVSPKSKKFNSVSVVLDSLAVGWK